MLLRVGQSYLRHSYTSLFPNIQLVFGAGGFHSSQIGTDPRYAPIMMIAEMVRMNQLAIDQPQVQLLLFTLRRFARNWLV